MSKKEMVWSHYNKGNSMVELMLEMIGKIFCCSFCGLVVRQIIT